MIEQNRVARFAVHLPPSKDLLQLAHVGTRHSAALGLAELADVLCLVVSEERGTISTAENGRLRIIDNPQALGAIIENFLETKFPSKPQKAMPIQFFRRN